MSALRDFRALSLEDLLHLRADSPGGYKLDTIAEQILQLVCQRDEPHAD